VRYEAAVIQ